MFGAGGYGNREITIRANGIGTPWHEDDLAAIAAAGPDGIVVPKVNSVEDVHAIESALEKHGAPDRTRIWAMLETPVAMLHAEEICSASERLDRAGDGHQRPGQGAARPAGARAGCRCSAASSCACWRPGRPTR